MTERARKPPRRPVPKKKAIPKKKTISRSSRGKSVAGPAKPKRATAPARSADVRDAVLAFVRRDPGATDEAVARKLKLTKARVAAACRGLEKAGLLERRRDAAGAITNHPAPTPEELARRDRARERRRENTEATALSDEDVREAVADWLAARGFEVERRESRDLLARRDGTTLACEALGGGKHLSMPRNAVPRSLSRLVERLGQGHPMYALAFPDLPAFRTAFAKLAPSMRRSLDLHGLFVRRTGDWVRRTGDWSRRSGGGFEVQALDPRGRPTNLL